MIIGRHLPIATLRAEFNAAQGGEGAA
ncbi:hypothetical protein N4G58_08345 [Edwardsiella piscicida]|nr:hypothetical protein N4G58_08345 [Edwardsiella piscicida]